MSVEEGIQSSSSETPSPSVGVQLLLASRSGDLRRVRWLVENEGASLDGLDGHSPLEEASSAGHYNVVRYLLKQGASSSSSNSFGATPLHLASCRGHVRIMEQILSRSSYDINIPSWDGWTPLHWASAYGETDAVATLTLYGANLEARDNLNGSTPLHKACRWGQIAVVQSLIERGANVHARDDECSTPLHIAVQRGWTEVVALLLQHGACVDSINEKGQTPYDLAMGTQSLIPLFLQPVISKVSDESLHVSTISDKVDLDKSGKMGLDRIDVSVTSYFDDSDASDETASSDSNSTRSDPVTVCSLHEACRRGAMDTVQYLILEQRIGDIDFTQEGSTPLHEACRAGCTDIVQFLLARGANVLKTNGHGMTPLQIAKAAGHDAIVKIIKDHHRCVDNSYGDDDSDDCSFDDIPPPALEKNANIVSGGLLYQQHWMMGSLFHDDDDDKGSIGDENDNEPLYHHEDMGWMNLYPDQRWDVAGRFQDDNDDDSIVADDMLGWDTTRNKNRPPTNCRI